MPKRQCQHALSTSFSRYCSAICIRYTLGQLKLCCCCRQPERRRSPPPHCCTSTTTMTAGHNQPTAHVIIRPPTSFSHFQHASKTKPASWTTIQSVLIKQHDNAYRQGWAGIQVGQAKPNVELDQTTYPANEGKCRDGGERRERRTKSQKGRIEWNRGKGSAALS